MLLDILIILYQVPFTILGYRDGVLKKCFGIISSIIALIIATKLMSTVGNWVSLGLSSNSKFLNIVAFFVIFLVLTISKVIFFRWWEKRRSGGAEPKQFSRVAGAVVGVVHGAILTSLLLVMLYVIHFPSDKMRQNSLLYYRFIKVAPKVFDYSTAWIPDSKAFFEELETTFGITKLSD